MSQTKDQRTKVYDILKGFSTALFVTGNSSGHKARPMHVAGVEEDAAEVWFLTDKSGSLVDEVRGQSAVLLGFQNDSSAYLSLRGEARLDQDRAKIKQLWKEPYKAWFPKGAEDPDITLVAVDLIDAEYWDNRGVNKLKYLFETAKAYVKGEKAEVQEPDQHAKTSL